MMRTAISPRLATRTRCSLGAGTLGAYRRGRLSAEHELKRLQGMLSSLGVELARREQEAEALRIEAEDLRRQLETALVRGGEGGEGEPAARADPATNFLVNEVAPILRAAE